MIYDSLPFMSEMQGIGTYVNNIRGNSPTDIKGTTLKLYKFILRQRNAAAEIVIAPQNRSSNQRQTNKILIQTMIDS